MIGNESEKKRKWVEEQAANNSLLVNCCTDRVTDEEVFKSCSRVSSSLVLVTFPDVAKLLKLF